MRRQRSKFTSACEPLRDSNNAVEAKKLELTGLINEREAQAIAVRELVVRARSGFKSVYGPDLFVQCRPERNSQREAEEFQSLLTSTLRSAATEDGSAATSI